MLALLLAQRGANPFVRDARGNLAVHLACAAENTDAVSQLIAHPPHGLYAFNGAYLNERQSPPDRGAGGGMDGDGERGGRE